MFAGDRNKKAPDHHDTVITSVSPTSITISQDKTSKTYVITQFTEFTYKGQKVALGELKPGMAVVVTAGVDGASASRIGASDPPVHNDDEKKATKKPPKWIMGK